MPKTGDHDDFEADYMERLEAAVVGRGLLIHYKRDRATLDLGLHLREALPSGGSKVTQTRVWMQAKGLRASKLPLDRWDAADRVAVSGIRTDHLRFWYASPEAVYLVVFVESADTFLAEDIRTLVDELGGLQFLSSLGDQVEVTLKLSKNASLVDALARMPRHRSMRIDGPAFRGRPLGHRYDPLRSELTTLPPDIFIAVVKALLDAHEFHGAEIAQSSNACTVLMGSIHLTYEWVLPLTTEFGYSEADGFRLEGEPQRVQGETLVFIDHGATGPSGFASKGLSGLVSSAHSEGIERVLVFVNAPEAHFAKFFAPWRDALYPLICIPQLMGSLTMNVLVTTNVYLRFNPNLEFRSVNYLY